MLTNFKRKIERKRDTLRDEKGATDPILVIAAIAVSLVLLVGGSYAVTGIITSGQNLNAKGDLDKIGVAQVANFAETDGYVDYSRTKLGNETGTAINAAGELLPDAGIGFTPTEGGAIQIIRAGDGWVARSISVATPGVDFFKSSESNAIVDNFAQLKLPDGATAATTSAALATLR